MDLNQVLRTASKFNLRFPDPCDPAEILSQIITAIRYIDGPFREFTIPAYGYSAYSLKHRCEEVMTPIGGDRPYINEGAMILALLIRGIPIRPAHIDGGTPGLPESATIIWPRKTRS